MKRLLALVLLIPGCGVLGSLAQIDPQHRPEIVCVAHYTQLTPSTLIGHDDCGNFWTRAAWADSCEILSSDGRSMITIVCPAEGDTLSMVPGGLR